LIRLPCRVLCHSGEFWVHLLLFCCMTQGNRSRKALRCSSSMGECRLAEATALCRARRPRSQRRKTRGESTWVRVVLARETHSPRAGDSAFAGPRSPAPLARGGASGRGRAVLQSCYGTSVGTRHSTPRLCWCQHSYRHNARCELSRIISVLDSVLSQSSIFGAKSKNRVSGIQ
jgi:hypothetical protein